MTNRQEEKFLNVLEIRIEEERQAPKTNCVTNRVQRFSAQLKKEILEIKQSAEQHLGNNNHNALLDTITQIQEKILPVTSLFKEQKENTAKQEPPEINI